MSATPESWLPAARHLGTATSAETRNRALEILAAASQLRPDAPGTLVYAQEVTLDWIQDGEHTVIHVDSAGNATPAFFGTHPDPNHLRSLGLGPTLLEQLQDKVPELERFDGFWGRSYRTGRGKAGGQWFKVDLENGIGTLFVGDTQSFTVTCPTTLSRQEEYDVLGQLIQLSR